MVSSDYYRWVCKTQIECGDSVVRFIKQTMKITILTLFPGMFAGPFAESIIGRALERDVCEIDVVDLRSFTTDKHHVADDTPYGGGGGMVMKVEPIIAAVEATRTGQDGERVIFLTPQGRPYYQAKGKDPRSGLAHILLSENCV